MSPPGQVRNNDLSTSGSTPPTSPAEDMLGGRRMSTGGRPAQLDAGSGLGRGLSTSESYHFGQVHPSGSMPDIGGHVRSVMRAVAAGFAGVHAGGGSFHGSAGDFGHDGSYDQVSHGRQRSWNPPSDADTTLLRGSRVRSSLDPPRMASHARPHSSEFYPGAFGADDFMSPLRVNVAGGYLEEPPPPMVNVWNPTYEPLRDRLRSSSRDRMDRVPLGARGVTFAPAPPQVILTGGDHFGHPFPNGAFMGQYGYGPRDAFYAASHPMFGATPLDIYGLQQENGYLDGGLF